MITPTLVQRKIPSLNLPFDPGMVSFHFNQANRQGVLTLILISLLGVSLAAYLIALFLSFSTGLTLQRDSKILENSVAQVLQQELVLRQRQNTLAESRDNLLRSMEKITSIKYITPTNITALRVAIEPH